ncbi:MAG: hypothetical protein EOO52_04430 [Gammaproteobacteria bacterium]|nr:MAG: hypothetical protein EOO52_04430 [Gammaproteobacteria bacterium]
MKIKRVIHNETYYLPLEPVKGELLSVEVASRPYMGAIDPSPEYYLELKVKFFYSGREYICSQSPYQHEGVRNASDVAEGLRKVILTGAEITVYFDPNSNGNFKDAIAVVGKFYSWDDFISWYTDIPAKDEKHNLKLTDASFFVFIATILMASLFLILKH